MDERGRSGHRVRLHHADHRPLLRRVRRRPRTRGRVDGIVVPTHRPVANLDTAFALAATLHCPVVAMTGTAPDAVVQHAERTRPGLRCYAVPAEGLVGHDALPRAAAEVGSATHKQRVVAAGRSTGLLLARLAGWRTLLFLDDDVRHVGLHEVRDAARALHPDEVAAVGWPVRQFPDNSVVCHANRLAGNPQHSFVGAGALLVAVDGRTPFFPAVYNEDWLFLFDVLLHRHVGRTGNALQLEFDPYEDPARAVAEEFGDLLAEGAYHLLHLVRAGAVGADRVLRRLTSPGFWEDELAFRAGFVGQVRDQLAAGAAPTGDEARVGRALEALRAAEKRLAEITVADVVDFVRAWRADLDEWSGAMARLHPLGSLRAALDALHLGYETTFDERSA